MEENKTDYTKTIRRIILFVSVGLGLHVLFLLYTVDRSSFASLKNIHLTHILLMCLLAICPWIGHTIRVMIWSKFISHPMGFRELFPVMIVNDIGAALTPTALGGGPVKMAILIKKGMPASKATFLMLMSAVEDICFYIIGIILSAIYLKSTIGKIFHYLSEHLLVLITVLTIITLPFIFRQQTKSIIKYLILLLPEKRAKWFFNVKRNLTDYLSEIGAIFKMVIQKGKLRFLLSLNILILQWMTKFSILAVLLISLNVDFMWFDMYIKQWLISVSMLVFPTPGAAGGSEAAFLYIFQNEVTGDLANLIVSTWRFFTYYFTLIIAIFTLTFFTKTLLSKSKTSQL